ncbi:unnamed protein product [Vicia faba]|uniref:Tf2-1-like SH3-like domain-containing protein n=1 Tax=Vicia faba TaxID=3906 RepID=A0AAV0ZUR8_VICFA|nr:unnamed protein product [Vicia faba]
MNRFASFPDSSFAITAVLRRLLSTPNLKLVEVHLRKERFLRGQFAKLKPRADGPFKVLKRIGENAYKIELPAEYEVSETLKVSDLFPYYGEESTNDSGASLLQLDGEN